MAIYHIIYGGRKHIEADSEDDAYRLFWQWVIEQAEAGHFGLIVDSEEDAEE